MNKTESFSTSCIRLGVTNMDVGSIPASVTYLHVTPHISGAAGSNYNWSVVNDFIAERDAWTVISGQDNYGTGPMNNTNSPITNAGYNDVEYSEVSGWSQVFQDRATPSKIYEFVMEHSVNQITPAQIGDDFYNDAISTSIPSPWPSTAVVLMTKVNNDSHASLIVDIENKFIYVGESQIFWYDAYLTNGRGLFLENLIFFVAHASMYGSNFTDLLLEEGQPGVQPAPWDSYWDESATGGTDNRGVVY